MSALNRIPPLARFEESPIRRVLIDRLREAAVNEVVSYGELSRLAQSDVQRESRHLLSSARSVLERHDRVLFDAVTNVGLKRMDSVGVLYVVGGRQRRTHRGLKKTARILTIAEYEKLPQKEQDQYRLLEIRTALQLQFGGRKIETRLLRAVEQSVTPKQLKDALTGTLKQFGQSDNG